MTWVKNIYIDPYYWPLSWSTGQRLGWKKTERSETKIPNRGVQMDIWHRTQSKKFCIYFTPESIHHGRGTEQWSRQNDLASFLQWPPPKWDEEQNKKVAKMEDMAAIYGPNFMKYFTNVYLATAASECLTLRNRSQYWAHHMRLFLENHQAMTLTSRRL